MRRRCAFPVPGTLIRESSRPRARRSPSWIVSADALIAIHGEMAAVASGESEAQDQQPAEARAAHRRRRRARPDWDHPYTRETAAFPDAHTRAAKFWPAVGRVDNVYGDRNLVCVQLASAWSSVRRGQGLTCHHETPKDTKRVRRFQNLSCDSCVSCVNQTSSP